MLIGQTSSSHTRCSRSGEPLPATGRAAEMNRRECIRAGCGGFAVAATWLLSVAAQSLLSQREAEYQSTPNGLQMCGTCTLFIRPHGCKLVSGEVDRAGWCKLYDMAD